MFSLLGLSFSSHHRLKKYPSYAFYFFSDQDHRSPDVESAALHTFQGYISSDTDEVRLDEATTVSLSLKTPSI